MELVADKASGKQFEPGAGVGGICRDLSAQAGLVMRAVGDTMIISPPLIMTHEQIDELVTLAHQALDQTLAAIKKSL
jgi:putrescine aminotransferase